MDHLEGREYCEHILENIELDDFWDSFSDIWKSWISNAVVYRALITSRHWIKHFIYLIHDCHSNPKSLSSSPLYRWEKWDSERLSDLPKVTEWLTQDLNPCLFDSISCELPVSPSLKANTKQKTQKHHLWWRLNKVNLLTSPIFFPGIS